MLTSWGVYLIASASLVLLLSPQLSQVTVDARASADWRNLDGARSAMDAIRPGVTLPFSYGDAKVSDPLRLLGHEVYCSDGRGTLNASVRWALPDYTLVPGVRYVLSLSQGAVVVTPAV